MEGETGPEERGGGDGGPERGPPAGGTGLEENMAGALCYALGLITGIIFLVLDQGRPTVRYHAFQSIGISVVWIVLMVVTSILGVIPFIGWILGALLGLVLVLGGLALWLYLMWQAYEGNEPELPVVGGWARSQASTPPTAG